MASLSLALTPVFGKVAPFGWFIGAALSAVLYFFIARGRVPVVPADLEGAVRPTTPTTT